MPCRLTIIAYAIIVSAVTAIPNITPDTDQDGASAAPAHRFYAADTYALDDSVGHLMHHVTASIRREVEVAMAAHDLTAAQWLPIWKIQLGMAATAQELSRQMDADAGAITRLLDRLEAKGLIQRERSAADRRVVNLRLTPAGEEVARHIPAVLSEVQNRFLQGFSVDQWEQLKSLLRRMLANCPKVKADDAGRSDAASAACAERRGRPADPR